MKKLLTTIILLTIIATLHAQAPELKNMMPNSWQKLTRLSSAEEKDFFHKAEVRTAIQSINNSFFSETKIEEKYYQVFAETNCGIEFYRFLISDTPLEEGYTREYKNKTLTEEECSKMQEEKECIWQIVFLKNKKNELQRILIRSYAAYWVSQGEWEGYEFNDLMIKPLNEKEIGFFITEVRVAFTTNIEKMSQNIVPINYNTCKGQIVGSNYTDFFKYNINDDINNVWNNDGVTIQASHCLFDSKCPLKYSIQNAFDGNPATSYVENTEDDLMKVIFQYRGQYYVKRIGIINGYAANKNLYNSNSRIFKMKCGTLATTTNLYPDPINIEFKDNEMSYQYFDFLSDTHFYVTDIFKGQKYSDTCLAEINLYTNKEYWLFGEVDE